MVRTLRAKVGWHKLGFLKKEPFLFIISPWIRARGVCDNMSCLPPDEAGLSPAGSTPKTLLKGGVFVFKIYG